MHMTLVTTLLSIYGLIYFNPPLYDLLADSNNLNSTYMMRFNNTNTCVSMNINFESMQSIRNSMIELHSNRIIVVTKFDKQSIKFEHLKYTTSKWGKYVGDVSYYEPLHIKIIKLISLIHGYDTPYYDYLMYFIKDTKFEVYKFEIDKEQDWSIYKYTPKISSVSYEYKILEP